MKPEFRISGYPWSQLIISGSIAAACVAPIIVMTVLGKPVPLGVLIFVGGMCAICAAAFLAVPVVVMVVDEAKASLTVRWISIGGLVRRQKTLRVSDIRKVVYGVTTLHAQFVTKHSYHSRHSFYAQLADGSNEDLTPESKATRGLSRKLGRALSEHLGVPFVHRKTAEGHFVEEPMT